MNWYLLLQAVLCALAVVGAVLAHYGAWQAKLCWDTVERRRAGITTPTPDTSFRTYLSRWAWWTK